MSDEDDLQRQIRDLQAAVKRLEFLQEKEQQAALGALRWTLAGIAGVLIEAEVIEQKPLIEALALISEILRVENEAMAAGFVETWIVQIQALTEDDAPLARKLASYLALNQDAGHRRQALRTWLQYAHPEEVSAEIRRIFEERRRQEPPGDDDAPE